MPAETALISIIVPVYNTRPYLQRCMDSLLSQTYPHVEVIFVDDGSTDGSADEIKALMDGDARCRLYRQANQGAGPARNLGLAHARGEYIAFVDSDDYVQPDYLQAMYEQMQHDHSRLCFCAINVVDLECKMLPFNVGEHWRAAVIGLLESTGAGSVCNRLFARSVIADSRFSEGRTEDLVFMIEVLLQSQVDKISHVRKPLYNYVMRKGSSTNSPPCMSDIEGIGKNLQHLGQVMDQYDVDAEIGQYYALMCALWYFGELYNLLCHVRNVYPYLPRLQKIVDACELPEPDLASLLQWMPRYLRRFRGPLKVFTLSILYHWPLTAKAIHPPIKAYRLLRWGYRPSI